MLVIGVTGGIASGKTMVSRELGRRGAAVINADRVGHAVLRLQEVKQALHARWGASVFRRAPRSDDAVLDEVDRGAVARRVFAASPAGPRELAFLEHVTHPLIETLLKRRLARLRLRGNVPVAVLDAPVLYKAGWQRYCDRTVYVDAPLEVRLQRVAQRGWSAQQMLAREKLQPDLEFQRQRADVVIDNGGSREATMRQIDAFWNSLRALREEPREKKADGL